jgi:hypothetical protein
MIDTFIRNGIDQCKQALRKLSNRKLFRAHKISLGRIQREELSRGMELRELKLDDLSSKVEEIIGRVRNIMYDCNTARNDLALYSSGDDENDNYVGPFNNRSDENECNAVDAHEDLMTLNQDLGPFNPHPFARTKRSAKEQFDKQYFKLPRNRKVKFWPTKRYPVPRNKMETEISTFQRGLVTDKERHSRSSCNSLVKKSKLSSEFVNGFENVSGIDKRVESKLRQKQREARKRGGKDMCPQENTKQRESIAGLYPERELRSLAPRPQSRRQHIVAGQEGSNLSLKRKAIYRGLLQKKIPSVGSINRSVNELPIDRGHVREQCLNFMEIFPSGNACLIRAQNASIDDKDLAFRTFHDCLKSDGGLSLPELLHTDFAKFKAYVLLIITIARMIRETSHACLCNDSGRVFNIFSDGSNDIFFAWIVLQFADLLYALMHPTAWATNIRRSKPFLLEIAKLRDELANHFPLTEQVSLVLMSQLGNQKWYCNRSGDAAYCSSIDPTEWQTFLSDGNCRPSVTQVRLASFENGLPQAEIDVIWRILGFVAASCEVKRMNGDGDARWKLIELAFSQGSFAVNGTVTENCLPPCAAQIDAVVSDLCDFSALVASGALDNLPGSDGLLLKTIQRSIKLQCDAFAGALVPFHANSAEQSDESIVKVAELRLREIFIDTDCLNKLVLLPERHESRMKNAMLKVGGYEQLKNLCVVPPSQILKAALILLCAWREKLPMKRVRQQRFCNALKMTTKNLKEDKVNVAVVDAAPSFAALFSLDAEEIRETRANLFLNESCAYLYFLASLFEDDIPKNLSGSYRY